VEAFVLDFDGPLRGTPLGLHLLARLRGQQKFAGVELLISQLRNDVSRVREFAAQIDALRSQKQIGLTEREHSA